VHQALFPQRDLAEVHQQANPEIVIAQGGLCSVQPARLATGAPIQSTAKVDASLSTQCSVGSLIYSSTISKPSK
jgi:hypothetical protein